MATENAGARHSEAPLLAKVDAAWFKIESLFNFAAAMVILGLMLLAVVQVVGRSVFNQPVSGYVDLVEISMTVFAFLGLSYCQKLGGHVRMEIIIGRFKGRVFWALEVFGILVAIFIISVLMYYGWLHFLRAWEIGDSTMDIMLPLWPSKLLVPIAFAMLLVRLLIQLVGFLRLCRQPDATPIGVPIIETVDEQARHEIEVGLGDEALSEEEAAKAGAQ